MRSFRNTGLIRISDPHKEKLLIQYYQAKTLLHFWQPVQENQFVSRFRPFCLPGVCLVISPLIALMQDQVARLKELGIQAAAIHSGMHWKEMDAILSRARYGDLKLLYLSPERLETKDSLDAIQSIPISLIAVDEAHCISQWGHDFRPAYLKIATIREFTKAPILALTATATQKQERKLVYI